jgi:hypothetical protein
MNSQTEAGFDLPKDQAVELERLAQKLTVPRVVSMIELLMDKRREFSQSTILQLPLELAVVEFCVQAEAEPPAVKPEFTSRDSTPKKAAPRAAKSAKAADPKAPQAVSFSLEQVIAKWNEILAQVKEYNNTLFSFLQITKPVVVKNNVIQLGVAYSFHKERIEELKNRIKIEMIIGDVIGAPVKIECVTIEKTAALNAGDQDLEALAQEFGGSVIN